MKMIIFRYVLYMKMYYHGPWDTILISKLSIIVAQHDDYYPRFYVFLIICKMNMLSPLKFFWEKV